MEHHLRYRLGILRLKTTQHTIINKDITGTTLLIFLFIIQLPENESQPNIISTHQTEPKPTSARHSTRLKKPPESLKDYF